MVLTRQVAYGTWLAFICLILIVLIAFILFYVYFSQSILPLYCASQADDCPQFCIDLSGPCGFGSADDEEFLKKIEEIKKKYGVDKK